MEGGDVEPLAPLLRSSLGRGNLVKSSVDTRAVKTPYKKGVNVFDLRIGDCCAKGRVASSKKVGESSKSFYGIATAMVAAHFHRETKFIYSVSHAICNRAPA